MLEALFFHFPLFFLIGGGGAIRWRGKNKLGDALMDVRRQLREEVYEREFSGGGGFPCLKSTGVSEDMDTDEDETIGDDRARRK